MRNYLLKVAMKDFGAEIVRNGVTANMIVFAINSTDCANVKKVIQEIDVNRNVHSIDMD